MKYLVGVDLGGTKIHVGISDLQGNIVAEAKEDTVRISEKAVLEQISSLINEMLKKEKVEPSQICGIGIGVPGIVDYKKGEVIWAPNLPNWKNIPLRRYICRKVYNLPVYLENDVDCAVLGEAWLGVAKGKKDVVFISIGTGIGSGLLLGGKLYRGSSGVSGAIGWFILGKEGMRNKYTRCGHLEAISSGVGIKNLMKRYVEDFPWRDRAQARKYKNIDAKEIFHLARVNDRLARAVVKEALIYLGMGVANVVSIINPEMVVIGGGVGQASDIIIPEVKKMVDKYAQPYSAKNVCIVQSKLGTHAGLYGALRLPLQDF
jgi:glucokinase